MLGNLSQFVSPSIEQLLSKLQADEDNYELELRTLGREKLVLPVQLTTPDGEFELHAFSRNVSQGGIGLIAPQPFSPNSVMRLTLNMRTGKTIHVVECRWCETFGQTYWTSGWELKSKALDVQTVLNAEAVFDSEVRSSEREKYAIPVVVHQPGERPKVHAFTRNMSGDGVNLVANKPVCCNEKCTLEFVRNDGERSGIVAECIWLQEYGADCWMSGWQFSSE
ncbi:PilZ domain-containing protein [Mariniblastus fucicola]|uniref:PilZ domain protein n=1 Tax=Mariniblastus fucicola TaxID=980251 RepID=A0A5B9PFC3_9BACT|nr:PilZ domain-containing protein [Mariniblastus fucicola]QEG23336.1 PilZ domain protein [Mariniblastus fucicola]